MQTNRKNMIKHMIEVMQTSKVELFFYPGIAGKFCMVVYCASWDKKFDELH